MRHVQRTRNEMPRAIAIAIATVAAGCAVPPQAEVSSPDPIVAAEPEPAAVRVVVELETAEWADEELYIALFQDPDGWLEADGWLVGRSVAVTPPLTVIVFDDVPARPTAVSGFVDLEKDQNLTRNGLGIPVEPWGFSNDLSVLFVKPSFRAACVDLAPPECTVRFAIGRSLDRSSIRRARREAVTRESS